MKQPESLDIGTKMDVARHRLNIAKEGIAFKKKTNNSIADEFLIL